MSLKTSPVSDRRQSIVFFSMYSMYTTFGSFFAYLNQQQSLFVVDVVGESGSIQGSSFRYTLAISKAKIKHASFMRLLKKYVDRINTKYAAENMQKSLSYIFVGQRPLLLP